MPKDVSSEDIFRLATEKTFTATKLLREAQNILADAKRRALVEKGSSFTNDSPHGQMLDLLREVYGGDSLAATLGNCVKALSVELVGLEGVKLEFDEISIKLESVTMPTGVIFGGELRGGVPVRLFRGKLTPVDEIPPEQTDKTDEKKETSRDG